jgi:predicted metal-dependent phosphoesterase TrpH
MQHPFRADLHSHTICSDGADSPLKLLHLAHQAGLQGLSITDHDTINAYTPDFFLEAEKLNIRILAGIEISSEQDDVSVHILGYGFDLNSLQLEEFLVSMQKRRRERNLAILQKLALKKLFISEEELMNHATQRTVGRPHIAELMVKKGYVQTVQDAFSYYLRDGASCYASGIKYSPKEVIEEIHKANGKAVLAHPHFLKKGFFLKKLLDLPFDGIECYYALLAKELELPWVRLAQERGLIPTGGSDYHGALKPHISLGCSWVGEDVFTVLGSKERKGSGGG